MLNSCIQDLKRSLNKEDRLKRKNRLSLMLNNREARALGIYCSRYRVRNKSEFLRETIMKAILKRFDDEHPTLWEEPEPTLFS
jgi:hypothetical protein